MGIKLGRIKQGMPYTVEAAADETREGLTLVSVGWQPAPDSRPFSYQMRLERGQTGFHTQPCPSRSEYELVELRAETDGHATLTVSGLEGDTPMRRVSITRNVVYVLEIVS